VGEVSPSFKRPRRIIDFGNSAGPDPWLTGEFGFETVKGVQSVGVQAVAKHYLANNQEHWRYGASSIFVDDRTEREIYWYPFLRAFEADVAGVMCAYNRVNGTSSCHNKPLLDNLRRGAASGTGFQGTAF
jgi:beta-glucosidase